MFTDSTLHRRLAGSVTTGVQAGKAGPLILLGSLIGCLCSRLTLSLRYPTWFLGFLFVFFLLDAVICYYPRPTIYLCTNSSTARTHPTDILLSTYPRNTNTQHATGHYIIVSYKHIPNEPTQPNQQALRYHTNTYIHRNIKRTSSSKTLTSPSY
ncbi:hypothetical protein An18g02120 [Aspergillus niger]|uniref:Uncharacterized protein n=2 Tax=Aspergillus niger TaxID=5061 RepID=A2RA69_ASPNC|nr:hypothetical protein An18g02120 [Aspergillus niger]CAK47284.1 hypothetical protein An18g02120 [Aspergillus niger]